MEDTVTKMKLLFVLPSLSQGGAERVLSVVAGWLQSTGNYEIKVVTMANDREDYSLPAAIDVIHLHVHSKKVVKQIDSLRKLYQVVCDFAPDLIIDPHYHYYSVPVAKLLGRKIVVAYRNDPFSNPSSMSIKIARLMFRFANYATFQVPQIRDFFADIVGNRSNIIANPIAPSVPQRWTGVRRKTFAAANRLAEQKNIPMLLDAFAQFSQKHLDYTLEIYGEGDLLDELQEQAKQLGIVHTTKFCGFVRNLYDLIVDCSGFLSSSNFEGLSNSMLESLAMGLPCIVTDCPAGGPKLYIQTDVNGILVPVGDADAMARGMCHVVEEPEFAENLSKQAALIRNELSIDSIGRQWDEMIRMVIG